MINDGFNKIKMTNDVDMHIKWIPDGDGSKAFGTSKGFGE
jgi:hypothetical protein